MRQEQIAHPLPPMSTTSASVRRTTSPQPSSQQPMAARHNARHSSGWHPEDAPYTTGTHARSRATDADELEEDNEYYETHVSTSTRRYDQQRPESSPGQYPGAIVVHRRTRTPSGTRRSQPEPEPEAVPIRPRRHWHWLTYMGLGMVLMFLLWVSLSWTVQWWQLKQDDWTYGRPRTFQIDAVVGHNDSLTNPTHFITINLNRHIEIIEIPGGDASKARIYTGPVLIGPGQDLTPITLTFADVNGDGKLDMIVHVQGEQLVFINDGTGFRPLKPGEQVNLP
jgi:hypothetical protein